MWGGRTWWAHFEFTRINTTPTILPKKIEDTTLLSGAASLHTPLDLTDQKGDAAPTSLAVSRFVVATLT